MQNLADAFLAQPQWVQLIIIATVATFFAYIGKFAFAERKPASFRRYLFGDSQSFARAFVILVGSLFAAIMTGVHNAENIEALITIGAGIGLAVPEKVDDHLVKEELRRLNNPPLKKTVFEEKPNDQQKREPDKIST